ncbi:terminase small subunit [Escherichia coli]|nr:terminase small subunit [Escherichia coli]EIZ4553965.1 terminase small subunit [Escherichia coli]EIZ4564671.1 terminase small subunit [Escherichia coli]EJE0816574.1 terminase small subunit [Escherichia coli]EJE2986459.1 terminase small subunit [Escherichia coli]
MEVNKKQLADIFGASIRTIQNWQEQGMPVLRGGGKGNEVLYDSAAVIKWYAKRDAEIENEKLRREVEELRQASEADLQPGTIEYERHRLSPDDGGSCHLWLGRGVPPAVNRRR